jgi:hypothetical protein
MNVCLKCNGYVNRHTKSKICWKCYIKTKMVSSETRKKLSCAKKNKLPNNYKGVILAQGYKLIYFPEHPNSFNKKRYVREHRLVIEKQIGRFLSSKEAVHHINGNRLDNRIENLMLFSNDGSHLNYEIGNKIKKEDILFDGRKLTEV